MQTIISRDLTLSIRLNDVLILKHTIHPPGNPRPLIKTTASILSSF